jgi:hypothetical protein
VVRQIAAALSAAHSAGIVHRDVKPQNILFSGIGNEVWLTDFGICFVKEHDRATHEDEVVGPWAFIAPELEDGGVLDVREAADIYSLGKLIYYMISGGIIIPRERLAEPGYADVFSPGGRYLLLQLLLRKMVCKLDNRIANMSVVMEELQRIEDWDRQSVVPPFSAQARSKIEQLQSQAVEGRRVAAENLETRQAHEAAENQVRYHVQQWLRGELEKAKGLFAQGDAITAQVNEVTAPDLHTVGPSNYRAYCGLELVIRGLSIHYDGADVLQVFTCRRVQVRVQVLMPGQTPAQTVPLEDTELAILPFTDVGHPLLQMLQPGQLTAIGFQTAPLSSLSPRRLRHKGLARRSSNPLPRRPAC